MGSKKKDVSKDKSNKTATISIAKISANDLLSSLKCVWQSITKVMILLEKVFSEQYRKPTAQNQESTESVWQWNIYISLQIANIPSRYFENYSMCILMSNAIIKIHR